MKIFISIKRLKINHLIIFLLFIIIIGCEQDDYKNTQRCIAFEMDGKRYELTAKTTLREANVKGIKLYLTEFSTESNYLRISMLFISEDKNSIWQTKTNDLSKSVPSVIVNLYIETAPFKKNIYTSDNQKYFSEIHITSDKMNNTISGTFFCTLSDSAGNKINLTNGEIRKIKIE